MENEDSKFSIKFVSGNFNLTPYHSLKCPVTAKVVLSGAILGQTNTGIGHKYQSSGYGFEPLELLEVGMAVWEGKDRSFQFGDGRHLPLVFRPVWKDNVCVDIDRQKLDYMVSNFEPMEVTPATVAREHAAFQFINFYNDLFGDVERYEDYETLEELRDGQLILLSSRAIQNMFERRWKSIYQIPPKIS